MRHGQVPVGTKGCVPRLSPLLIPRPRLEERLADHQRTPVTLVCAPPGAGKTTLLVTALSSPHVTPPVTWLCLDERDNDPGRFLALLHSAVSAGDEPALEPSPLLPPLDALDELLGDLAGDEAARHVLVLDDLHVLRAPAALELLAYLLRHAPDTLDLVLASRADPPVGLQGLRLDGRLTEIRNAELAFSLAETAELLRLHDISLASDEVAALRDRTAGWVAGLRLAAVALQGERDPGRFVRSASRTEAVVSDYLLREVLVRQDEQMQWFLLRTSVADRLTPELAALLAGDDGAAAHLAELERSGIVVADHEDDRWYRYHALFGALLRARLVRHDPDLARELHGRAAQWCLEHDLPADAEAHAQAACDWDVLGELVTWRWIDATLQGLAVDGGLLPADLDPAVVAASPGLALVAAADACRRLNRDEAELYRGALDELPAASVDQERRVLDAVFGMTFGAGTDGDDRAAVAAAALRDTPVDDPSGPGLRRFGALCEAYLALDAGDLDAARAVLADLAERGDTCWVTAEAAALLALLQAAAGHYQQALPLVDAVLSGERGGASAQAGLVARLASVLSLAQRGEQRSATETLGDAGVSAGTVTARPVRLVEQVVRAGVGGVPGRPVLLDPGALTHPLAEQALLALGVLEAVTADGRKVALGGPGEQALVDARGRLAVDEPAAADRTVGPWLVDLAPQSVAHPRTAVEAAAMAAVACTARNDHDTARRHLGDALDLMAATGAVAPLLQHNARVVPLLQRHLSDLGERMGVALELLDRARPTGAGELVEPLTDRELEVLIHLPTLMSNAEIAADLYLSVNTVKTHLKAVYRKLGVDSRRQAVVRGRELELI